MRGSEWCGFVFVLSALFGCGAQRTPVMVREQPSAAPAPEPSLETTDPEPPWPGGELIDLAR